MPFCWVCVSWSVCVSYKYISSWSVRSIRIKLIRKLKLHIQIKFIRKKHTDQVDPYDSYGLTWFVWLIQINYDSYKSSWSVWIIWINHDSYGSNMTHTDQLDPYESFISTWVKGIFAHSLKMLGAPAIMLGAPSITPYLFAFNWWPGHVASWWELLR